MTTFNIRPAHRDSAKLLIGLAGPTGSGKTYSALLLASGIVDVTGGRIVGVDTESGRMLQYAPPGDEAFAFDYLELDPPFSPDRYRSAYEAAEAHAGPNGVVLLDSMSHEHEGPGGVLEWHDAEVERLAANSQGGSKERYNFPAWSAPKAARRKLINRVLQSSCHVVFCFRAKEKNVLVDKPGGRGKEIVNIGWSPITGDEWPYEMTIFALLNPEKKGVPIIDGFAYGKLPLNMRSLVSTEVAITSDTGRKLAKWAGNGQARAPVRSKAQAPAAPPPQTRPSRQLAKPNGTLIHVWYSDVYQNDVPKPEALDALHAAIAGARTQEHLADVKANNPWVPPAFEEEIEQAFRDRADAIGDNAPGDESDVTDADRAAVESGRHFDDLEPEEWRKVGEAAQPGEGQEDLGV